LINKSPTFKAFRAATFLSRSSFESLLNPLKIIQYAAAISYEEKGMDQAIGSSKYWGSRNCRAEALLT